MLPFLAGLMPFRTAAAVAAALVLIAGAWFHGRGTGLDKGRAELAEQRVEWSAAVAAEAQKARKSEQRMQAAVDSARDTLTAEQERIHAQTAEIVRLLPDAAAAGRLRDQLATARLVAAAVAPSAAADPDARAHAARCAAGVGLLAEGADLAAEGARLVARMAGERDGYAAEVIACVSSWPR